jgi:hypothetical protein
VIPQEKLEKAYAKGEIRRDDPNAPKDLDQDMDEKIDQVCLPPLKILIFQCIREVWAHYDPKGTGVLPKKVIQKFFQVLFWPFPSHLQDALDLYALRLGKKSAKEIIAPGVNSSQAMQQAIAKVLFLLFLSHFFR